MSDKKDQTSKLNVFYYYNRIMWWLEHQTVKKRGWTRKRFFISYFLVTFAISMAVMWGGRLIIDTAIPEPMQNLAVNLGFFLVWALWLTLSVLFEQRRIERKFKAEYEKMRAEVEAAEKEFDQRMESIENEIKASIEDKTQ